MATKGNCTTCKNAVILTGAFTNTKYVECGFEREIAEHATLEELRYYIAHPEEKPCKYCKGKPEDGGVTYDD